MLKINPLEKLKILLNNPIYRFLFLSFVYFLIWDILLYQLLIPVAFEDWVIDQVGAFSRVILSLAYSGISFSNDNLYIDGVLCVHIGIPCNGVETMGIISCIILAFRAAWFHKLWFILLNYTVIFLLNAVRVAVLAALVYERNQSYEINHKYIFNIVLYGVLLILFALWSQKISKQEAKPIN